MARESCGTAMVPLNLIWCKIFYSETCRERLIFIWSVLFWVCFCDCRCWLKDNNKAWLAHYFTTMTILVALVFSGLVMLYSVFRQIRSREEWRQNRVAFLSMWGLSCLFGTTWVLAFLSFGPFSQFFVFLFCILNSFQGLHMQNAISPYSSIFLSPLSGVYTVYSEWLDRVIFIVGPEIGWLYLEALLHCIGVGMRQWLVDRGCVSGVPISKLLPVTCWSRPKNRALPFSCSRNHTL